MVTVDAIIAWIAKATARAEYLLVPVSGGTDGALALWACSRAKPGKTIAIHSGNTLPYREWFENEATVVLTEPKKGPAREELRWAEFLVESRARNAWLVGTRNRTEHLLGAFSLASRVATFYPLIGVWKSDVIRLCREVGVPSPLIAASSLPDPDCGRPAELAAVTFDRQERYLRARLQGSKGPVDGLDPTTVAYLDRLRASWGFKTDLPTLGPTWDE